MDKVQNYSTDSDYLAYIKCRNEATKAVEESNCCYEQQIQIAGARLKLGVS